MTALAAGDAGDGAASPQAPGLDATEVLLSTVMATTDEELHAARMAAFRSPVREQLLKPWVPLEGHEAGAALLGTHPLFGRHRTTLAHRLGVVTRRLQSEGVGYYLLSPVEQASRRAAGTGADDQADAGGDTGQVSAPVALALAAAAVLLLATAGAGVVNGAALLGWGLLLVAARPLVRWASYEDRPTAAAGPAARPPATERRPVVVPEAGRYACPGCRARFRTAGDKRRHLRGCADLTGGPR